MTLQLLPSEFPYIWGKFYFLFYQCAGKNLRAWLYSILVLQNLLDTSQGSLNSVYSFECSCWSIYLYVYISLVFKKPAPCNLVQTQGRNGAFGGLVCHGLNNYIDDSTVKQLLVPLEVGTSDRPRNKSNTVLRTRLQTIMVSKMLELIFSKVIERKWFVMEFLLDSLLLLLL